MSALKTAEGRRPDGAAFIIALLLAAMGVVLIWQGWIIPDKGGYAGIGSGDMPVFIGAGLVMLAMAHAVKAWRKGAESIPPQAALPVLLIVSGLALQLILLKPLGFSIASGLLFACTAAAFGKRNPIVTVPIGLGFAFVIYGVFDRLLQLNLPAGFLETLIYGG